MGVVNIRSNFHNVFMRTFMYGMVGSMAMFISSWEKADRVKDQFLEKNRNYGDTYDFIIVGGGSAGCLIANRLSLEYKVLLLEAGGNPHPFHSIPFLANFMSNYKQVDWMHKTTPQKHAFFASPNNIGGISQGLSLGGTSNLDYMMYLRGNPQDYDNWATLSRDPSWSYQNLIPYFKKHEKYDGPWKDKQMHGENGEMRIGWPKYGGLAKIFCQGGIQMGYSQCDLNSHYSQGFDVISSPSSRGYRQTSYKSFLQRAQNRWNLVIHKYAHVNRILTRGASNEAYGVEYERHGKLCYAYAKKEIILSAGAIQSPKILMLSGIGPKEHLEALGIPSKVNLPQVGQNLQDHMALYLGPFFTSPKKTLLLDRDLTPPALFNYAMSKGPLTSTGFQAVAMLTSDLSKVFGNPHWPDIQLTLNGMALHDTADQDFSHAHRIKKEIMKEYYKGSKGRDSFSILVSASRPLSRGQVTLQDKNPRTPPLIDPKYLERIEDVGIMVDGIKKGMRLVENTLSFQEIGSKFTNKSVPGCSHYKFKSDNYWSCFVRLMSVSMGDVAGTVALGRVVSPQLAVYGTQRLRVMDASVMPGIVSSSTGAATLMIAEKGSHMVLEYWGQADKKETLQKESQKVKGILKASADKLKALDTSSIFLNSIKDSDTFKELDPSEVQEVLEGPQPQPFSFSSSTLNPFKLLGSIFKNSLNPRNVSHIAHPSPYFSTPPTPLSYFTPPSILKPTSTKRPSVETLFYETEEKRQRPPTPPQVLPTRAYIKSPSVDALFQNNEEKGRPQVNAVPSNYINYPLEEVTIIHPQTTSAPTLGTEVPASPFTLSPQPFISYSTETESPPSFYYKYESPESNKNKSPETFESAVASILSSTLPTPQTSSASPPASYNTQNNKNKSPHTLTSSVGSILSKTLPSPQTFIYEEESASRQANQINIKPPQTFESSVNSIISKTFPILRDSPKQSPFFLFSTPKSVRSVEEFPTAQPLTSLVAKGESFQGLGSHVKHYTLKPSASRIQASTPSSSSFASRLKTMNQNPIHLTQEDEEPLVPTLIQPFTQIAEPLTKMIKSSPLDGLLKRIRSVLHNSSGGTKKEQKVGTQGTQGPTNSLKSPNSIPPSKWMEKGSLGLDGVNSKVKNILSTSTGNEEIPYFLISSPILMSTKNTMENSLRFSHQLRPPSNYYNYETQVTGSNNTFNPNLTPSSTPINNFEATLPSSSSVLSPTSPPLEPVRIEANYKIVYTRPTLLESASEASQPSPPTQSPPSDSSKYGSTFADNVEALLRSPQASPSLLNPPLSSNSPETEDNLQRDPHFSSLFKNDPKNLEEEIEKLISSQNMKEGVEQIPYFLASNEKNVKEDEREETNLENQFKFKLLEQPQSSLHSTKQNPSSFSQSIHQILKQNSIKNANPSETLGDSRNIPINSPNVVTTKDKELSEVGVTHAPPTQFKSSLLWPAELSKHHPSFRIKILNQ